MKNKEYTYFKIVIAIVYLALAAMIILALAL
jgi:hypothetical protein